MSVRPFPRVIPGLILAAALTPLPAQSLLTKDLKVRLGYAPSTQDNLSNTQIGFGLNLGIDTNLGLVGLELGYSQKGGDAYQKPVTGPVPAGLSPIDPGSADAPAKVGDSRRNSLDGFSVRLSLSRPLVENWRWQAGLMLGGTRFKHEYVGDVSSADWNGANESSWRDFYFGTPTEGGFSASPYAGVAYKVSPRSSLEVNVLFLTYKALDYVHRPGTGNYAFTTEHPDHDTPGRLGEPNRFPHDTLEKKTRIVPHLEVSYVFHF